MSVKYTVKHNDQTIGTRRSASHLKPIYTHAVAIWGHGLTAKVRHFCSRLDLAQGEANWLRRQGFQVEILPVEARVTTALKKLDFKPVNIRQ